MTIDDLKDLIEQKQKSLYKATPLFDKKDIEDIVKGFVRAYLSGQIKVNLPHMQELAVRPEYKSSFKVDWQKASKDEVAIKTIFNNYIAIVAGTISSTQAEYDAVVKELFERILDLKSGDRIQGKFYEYDVEERLEKIEKEHKASMDVLKQEIRWLKDQLGV